jgi:hypothetical protein
MTRFTGLADTARDYILQFTVTHTYTHTHTHTHARARTLLSTVTSPLAVARKRLSTADFPVPLCFRTIPGLSYQLLTATAHKE